MEKYFKLIQTAPKVIGIQCLKSFLTLYINNSLNPPPEGLILKYHTKKTLWSKKQSVDNLFWFGFFLFFNILVLLSYPSSSYREKPKQQSLFNRQKKKRNAAKDKLLFKWSFLGKWLAKLKILIKKVRRERKTKWILSIILCKGLKGEKKIKKITEKIMNVLRHFRCCRVAVYTDK